MPKIYCEKCNKELEDSNFYTNRLGEKASMCKKCLTMHVNAFDDSTFLWILEKLDYPYVPTEWNILRDRDYQKKGPAKFDSCAVMGKYISKMKLNPWNRYHWADGPELVQELELKAEQTAKELAEKDAIYLEQYKRGELSEAAYRTLVSVPQQREMVYENPTAYLNPYLGPDNPYDENKFMRANELPSAERSLTREDKLYLAMKWGRMYQPDEWITLERNYTEMTNSFDIQDADTINTLILICKTDLKMNQAINQENRSPLNFMNLPRVS